MLESKILPISYKLAALAKSNFTADELEIFTKILNQLFIDLESGHSCSEVVKLSLIFMLDSTEIITILQKSKLVAFYEELNSPLKVLPISLWQSGDNLFIYVTKYLAYELRIYQKVQHLLSMSSSLDDNKFHHISSVLHQLSQKNGLPNIEQLQAIEASCRKKFSIITGGPGTGKTTTVTLLLWALYHLHGSDLSVKICAPTGKAAVRVRDSILSSIERLHTDGVGLIDVSCFDGLINDNSNFGTIHKLLGTQSQQIYFRYHHKNQLEQQVLIIDESSMVGLPLFSKLLDAVNSSTIQHIIFLGDKNQLSSVEEGYVFASLVNLKIMQENHNPHDLFSQYSEQSIASELITSKRNQGQISELATAILSADKKKLVSCLAENNYTALKPANLGLILAANCSSESSLSKYLNYAASQNLTNLNVKQLFSNLNQFANLCLTNRGVFGAENINSEIERKIKRDHAIYDEWYNGRPVMILQNDYNLELFNGDIGICIRDGEQVRIVFENNQQFIPELLPVFSLAYAITIHKSQGSEYSEVNVIIPESSTSNDGVIMVSRELFYTAVTRAKNQVTIFANQEILIRAIDNSATRVSGLSKMFATN